MKKSLTEYTGKIPFRATFLHYINELEMTPQEAIDSIQSYYSRFKERNERLTERQNDRSNDAQISLINQCTLLAIGILTIGSAFVGSIYQDANFTRVHTLLFTAVVLSSLTGLILGLVDYLQTITFHDKWAAGYHEIDKEVNHKFEDASIEKINELGIIEASHVDKLPKTTNILITRGMVSATFFSICLFFVLLLTYFYDVPLYKG